MRGRKNLNSHRDDGGKEISEDVVMIPPLTPKKKSISVPNVSGGGGKEKGITTIIAKGMWALVKCIYHLPRGGRVADF